MAQQSEHSGHVLVPCSYEPTDTTPMGWKEALAPKRFQPEPDKPDRKPPVRVWSSEHDSGKHWRPIERKSEAEMLSAWSSMSSDLHRSDSESIACVAKALAGVSSTHCTNPCDSSFRGLKRSVWRPHNPLVVGSSPTRPTSIIDALISEDPKTCATIAVLRGCSSVG